MDEPGGVHSSISKQNFLHLHKTHNSISFRTSLVSKLNFIYLCVID